MPALPSSLASRPQYGSWPYQEHLQSALSAIWRAPPRSASSSDRAPVTVRRTTFVAPSASPAISGGEVARTPARSPTASSSAGRPGRPRRWPGGSPCRWWTGSRRRSRRLKLVDTAPRSIWRSSSVVGLGVGGEHGEHRRHVRGEHRRALGHAADHGVAAPTGPRLLAGGVGGADRLGRGRCRRRRAAAGRPSAGTPPRIASIGSGMPMRPGASTPAPRAGRSPRPLGDRVAHVPARRPGRWHRWRRWRCRC